MAAKGHFVSQNYIINGRKVSRMMSDLKDRLLEEKLIVILRGLAEEKLIATVDILKNMGMHFLSWLLIMNRNYQWKKVSGILKA